MIRIKESMRKSFRVKDSNSYFLDLYKNTNIGLNNLNIYKF